MRIVQVTDKHPGQGGLGQHVEGLRQQLQARGFEVSVVRATDRPGASGDDIPVSYGPLAGRRAARALDAVLRRLAPDVVHLHAGFTTIAAPVLDGARRRQACVGTLHDVRPFCFHGDRWNRPAAAVCDRRCGAGCLAIRCVPAQPGLPLLRGLRRVGVETFARRAWAGLDAVVAPSRFVRDLALAHGFAAGRTHVVPHHVAVGDEPAGDAGPPPVVACVGSLLPGKGVDLLLQALARIAERPWTARIAGDGPERGRLEAMSRQLGLQGRVEFLGACAPARRDEVLAGARLAVMPSRLPESLGLAGLEALAQGRPVVGFGLGGTPEWLLHERTGLVAPAVDAAALAARIARLLDDSALARRLGRQGRALVAERFCAAATTDRLVALYEAVRRHRQDARP